MNLTISASSSSLQVDPRAKIGAAVDAALGLPADSASVSGPGKLLQQLQALAASDPSGLSAALTADAQKLTEAAKSETDAPTKQALTELAGRLTAAAKSGDLSTLRPPGGASGGGPPGGAPPPSGGGAGGAAPSSTQTLDPADLNQDGKVTEQERETYAARQAALGKSTAVKAYEATRAATRESAWATAVDRLAAG